MWPLLGVLVAVACGPDVGQTDLCELVLTELAGDKAEIRIERREADPSGQKVFLDYRHAEGEAGTGTSRIDCRFRGGRFDAGRLDLIGVRTDELGELSLIQLMWLRRVLHLPPPPVPPENSPS